MHNITTMIGVALAGVLLAGCHPNRVKPAAPSPVEQQAAVVADTLLSVSMADKDRNPVSLQEEVARHRVTILDFWASWCGPCRAEAPSLVSLYGQYAGSGLGIIGISLDEDWHKWQEAVAGLGLAWPQVSELRGWDNTLCAAYGIQSIPYTIVVDREGKILSRGLRGDELRGHIASLLAR